MANDNSQSKVILVFIMFVLVSIIGLGNPDDSTDELNVSEFEIPIVSRSTELIALESEETIPIQGNSNVQLDYYVNYEYECGLSGYYTSLVINPINQPDADAPLWVWLHGGGTGYWDEEGIYHSTIGQDQDTMNHQEDAAKLRWHVEVRMETNQGILEDQTLKRRIEEGYRVLVVSLCDHDLYLGMGTTYPNHPTNPDAQVNGLQATMAAIDHAISSYPTTQVWAHGTSAGGHGVWGLATSYAAEGNPITGIISDSGLTSPTYLEFQNITEQGLGGRQQSTWRALEFAEKVGFYTNLEIPAYPEAMISQFDFRAVPAIFILGDDDPFCYSDADPIPQASAKNLSNCGHLGENFRVSIENQINSPHELHVIPDTGHVPTNDPGSANDLVDAFIERILATNPANFLHHYYSPNQTIEDSEDYNVLYIGHSFGKIFAQQMEDLSLLAGITNHSQYIEMSGGASGAPDALWADDGHRESIKSYLDTGDIDVLIMICCSKDFIETGAQSDEAIWNFTSYAVESNPEIRIGLAFPWKDFPEDYENGTEYRNQTDWAYNSWVNLSLNLSRDFPTADVFTFHHGAVMYELRDMFEAGELENDVEQLSGPESTSIFRDRKGHAGQIAIDTGALVWLHAIHGVDPLTMPEFTQWETDIREVARKTIDEQNSA